MNAKEKLLDLINSYNWNLIELENWLMYLLKLENEIDCNKVIVWFDIYLASQNVYRFKTGSYVKFYPFKD